MRSQRAKTIFLDKLAKAAAEIVYINKVQIAQKEVEKVSAIMRTNVEKMTGNIEEVEEKLLPTVLDLEKEAQEAKQNALEIE